MNHKIDIAGSLAMADEAKPTPTIELARQLYREYYARCFWHLKPDLVVTESTLPIIIKGLCAHGGRRGMLAAARIRDTQGK